MPNICTNKVGLTDPHEPLPEILRRCLARLDPANIGGEEFVPKWLIETVQQCVANADETTRSEMRKANIACCGYESLDDWRRAVWAPVSDPCSAPVSATYVKFETYRGPPFDQLDELAAIFGRSLRTLWFDEQMGLCGWHISKPDAPCDSAHYEQSRAPSWIISELGHPDCVWSNDWQMHIPALGSFHPLWSQKTGWN